jgi:hypothetical protein
VFDIFYAGLSNAAMPALTAFKYAQFALAPAQYGDERALSLAALFIAQFPLCLLGAVFSGVSYIEGPSWRRVLVYVVVVVFVGALSGMAKLAYDSELGPIIGWALAMQLVILIFAGPQPALARARIDAGANDALNLSILTVYAGLLAIAGALLLQHFARSLLEEHAITFDWSDLAWVGAVYFALRAWSAVYVFTPAFEARRKGYFQRPWIEWLIRNMGRSSSGRAEP